MSKIAGSVGAPEAGVARDWNPKTFPKGSSHMSFKRLFQPRLRFLTMALSVGIPAALLTVGGCKQADPAGAGGPGGAQRPPAGVTVVAAVGRDVPIYLDEIGTMRSVESVAIVPQVGGKILAAPVEQGNYVKKGDVLFQIDPRSYQARLDAAKASLAQAQAESKLAAIEFKRIQQLAKNDVASQLEFDQKQNAVDVATAKIDSAKADVETAQLNLDYTKITSPIDGRAGARLVDVGNVVKENGSPLIQVQQIDPIHAQFTITESELGTVRKYLSEIGLDLGKNPERGLKVLVDMPADARQVVEALNGVRPATGPATRPSATSQPTGATAGHVGPREGTLTFLDSTVQNATGTIMLRAIVPNDDQYFWPGQFVNVRLILTTKVGAVLAPAQAIQIGQQGAFVYVVNDKSIAEIRLIVPGQRQGDMMVVEKGLSVGEKVIVTGQMMVMPGGPVMVVIPGQGGPPGMPGGAAPGGAAPGGAAPGGAAPGGAAPGGAAPGGAAPGGPGGSPPDGAKPEAPTAGK